MPFLVPSGSGDSLIPDGELEVRNMSRSGDDPAERDPSDVLYLDFDGPLHPEAVFWSFKRGAYLADALGSEGHRLFEHCELLEQLLLPYPHVRIVLSTSWVRQYSFSGAAKRLSAGLRSRCIGATWHSRMDARAFATRHRGEQVRDDVERRRPARWLALDDVDEGWGDERDNVVIVHPVEGIACQLVLNELVLKLGRFEKATTLAQPSSDTTG